MNVVSPGERLSRFLLDKKLIRASDNTVRHAAFMPPKNGKLSVYRTDTINEVDIWDIGTRLVATIRHLPIIGRADLQAKNVFDAGLNIVSEPAPHPLHADITGWSLESSADRLKALKLATSATVATII